MGKYKLDCRLFNGYKPCSPGRVCEKCANYTPMGRRILVINCDALGDVLRTTAMLGPLKRKYKESQVTWLTDKSAFPLLENNNYIDRILEYSTDNIIPLLMEKFDILMNVDKSRRAAALANAINAKEKLGFGLSDAGSIVPLNKEAEELYELGLSDRKKFKENKKTEQELLCQTMGLEYKRNEYVLNLTDDEKVFAGDYKSKLGIKKGDTVIGFNTGCSNLYPYKKLPFAKQAELIEALLNSVPDARIALLGGREDTENNARLKAQFQDKIISTPTDKGLRKGILFVEACDIVITGDTLGLHMAIALKKDVIVWFGISCENEIDLYNRGVKLTSEISCRPCWKRSCEITPKCNDLVDISKISEAVKSLIKKEEPIKR